MILIIFVKKLLLSVAYIIIYIYIYTKLYTSYKSLITTKITAFKNITRFYTIIKPIKKRKTCIKCKEFYKNKENMHKTAKELFINYYNAYIIIC